MRQGTISVLCGCHSPMHSIIVLTAWWKIYHRLPSWWQVICIFIHDIGHWGKDYLDDYEQKKRHGELGANIAKRLFGDKGYAFLIGHNPYNGAPKSELHDPDKYSWVIAPTWWMMSNCIFEPKLQRMGNTKRESAVMFKEAMRENWKTGFKELGHEIYLKQWGHYQEETKSGENPCLSCNSPRLWLSLLPPSEPKDYNALADSDKLGGGGSIAHK